MLPFSPKLLEELKNACIKQAQKAHEQVATKPTLENSYAWKEGSCIRDLLKTTVRTKFDLWECRPSETHVPPELVAPAPPDYAKLVAIIIVMSIASAFFFFLVSNASLGSLIVFGAVLCVGRLYRERAEFRDRQWEWQQQVLRYEQELAHRQTEGLTNNEADDADWLQWQENAAEVWLQLSSLIRLENENQKDELEKFREQYEAGDAHAIANFAGLALVCQPKPSEFPRQFHISFNEETSVLVVDYNLPSPSLFNSLKKAKLLGGQIKLVDVAAKETQSIYDSTVYELLLAAAYWIFLQDDSRHIQSVVLNGRVQFVHGGTGKPQESCIASVHITREQLQSIDLENVNPRDCFRHLKGIGSHRLFDVVPVSPIIQIDKEDKRFVENVDVADRLTAENNLAAMGWEDFEQLIREIFEKEFSSTGGEVKVTRASRDGGVDAVAFDPDPIRGGKIVIQAKRYTNTVDVSAVRDLYGTVMNEGASKGILVTTSGFGSDSYAFAKDKPITLLNGSNLLFLLERHGHTAYIDLVEAKKLNNAQLQHRQT